MSLAVSPVATPVVLVVQCSVCGERGITAAHECPGAHVGALRRGFVGAEPEDRRELVVPVAPSTWYAVRTVTVLCEDGHRAVVPRGHVAFITTPVKWIASACELPCAYSWSAAMIAAAHDGRPMWAVSQGHGRFAGVATFVARTATLRCRCGFECRTEHELRAHTGVHGVLRPIVFDAEGNIAMEALRFAEQDPEVATVCCNSSRTLGCRCPGLLCRQWVVTSDCCGALLEMAGVPPGKAEFFRGRGIDGAYSLMCELMHKNRRALQIMLGVSAAGPVLKFLEPIAKATVLARWSGGDLRYVSVQSRPAADASVAEMQLLLGLLTASDAVCCCGRCADRRCFGPLRALAATLGVKMA